MNINLEKHNIMNIKDFSQMTHKSYFRNGLKLAHKKSELLAKEDNLHKNAWGFKVPGALLYIRTQNGP